jgi:hypothetical protein
MGGDKEKLHEKSYNAKRKFKKTMKDIGKGMENAFDFVWHGETDKQKQERLAEEKQHADEIISFLMYGSLILAILVGGYYIIKRR